MVLTFHPVAARCPLSLKGVKQLLTFIVLTFSLLRWRALKSGKLVVCRFCLDLFCMLKLNVVHLFLFSEPNHQSGWICHIEAEYECEHKPNQTKYLCSARTLLATKDFRPCYYQNVKINPFFFDTDLGSCSLQSKRPHILLWRSMEFFLMLSTVRGPSYVPLLAEESSSSLNN